MRTAPVSHASNGLRLDILLRLSRPHSREEPPLPNLPKSGTGLSSTLHNLGFSKISLLVAGQVGSSQAKVALSYKTHTLSYLGGGVGREQLPAVL